MPAPRSSSSAADRSNTVTWWPASASTQPAVKPPSEPPTTAMSTRKSGLTECGDLIDRALEQHTALVDRWIAQTVRTRLLRVLRPDLVEVLRDPLAFDRVVLGDLAADGVLDADPVIRIGRIDEKTRQPRILADPAGLGSMLCAVHQDQITLVVEPHRGEIGATAGADDAEHLSDRIVQQLLVGRLEIGQRVDRGAVAHCELAGLRPGRDITEFCNFDAHGRTPIVPGACGRNHSRCQERCLVEV